MLMRLAESAPAHAVGADNAGSEHAMLRQSRCGCRASEVVPGPSCSGLWHWQQWLNRCSHSEVEDWHRSSPASQQHRMEKLEPVILLFLQERLWGLFLLLFCVFPVLAWSMGVYFCPFFAFRKVNLLEREKQMMMTKQVRSLRSMWSVMKRKKMMINIEEAQQLGLFVVVFSIYMFIYIVQFC